MEFSTHGKHVLVDVWGVDFDKLNNLEELKHNMVKGATACGANVISTQEKQFEPNGVTVLLLLSESHFSIHTYPEQGYAGIDCYTCGDNVSPIVAVNHLIDYLQPKKVKSNTITRGFENNDVSN